MTYGEKAVGLTFNPSGDPMVHGIKATYAAIIDNLNSLREHSSNQEAKRLCSIAITEAQGAQMWAVKAITWKDEAVDATRPAEAWSTTNLGPQK